MNKAIKHILNYMEMLEKNDCLTEIDLQKGVISVFEICGLFCHHNIMNSSSVSWGKKVKKMGSVAGVPDLLCELNGKFVLVELKTKTGKLSKIQKEKIDYFTSKNLPFFVIYGYNDFVNFLDENSLYSESEN